MNVFMTRDQAIALFTLLMCVDPTPLSPEDDKHFVEFADRVAKSFGYSTWIVAYHEMKKEEEAS